MAFHNNDTKLPLVDHINNDKKNNDKKNLRWVTHKKNSKAYSKNFRKLRAILQYEKNGKLIKRWKSMTELLKNNPKYRKYRKYVIYCYFRDKSKAAYGYLWEWLKEGESINMPITIIPIKKKIMKNIIEV